MTSEPLSLERILLKKVPSHQRRLHRKFQNRFLRLDMKRRAYILHLIGIIYQIMKKSSPFLYFGTLNSVLEELESQVGGLCCYPKYKPETIAREDPNMILFDFICLSTSQAKIIITITEMLVDYSLRSRQTDPWDVIEEEFEIAMKELLEISS